MSRGLSASLPDLDSEPWVDAKERHCPSPVTLKESISILEETSNQLTFPEEPEQEERGFLFDEEMEHTERRKVTVNDWSDDDSDYEIDDQDLNKILIVAQTPQYMRKHHGGDRTGTHTSQADITSDLAEVINHGLYYYEQDMWAESENTRTAIKVTISGEHLSADSLL